MLDFHIHSSASDGSDPPAGLVGAAQRAGLSAIALTDHDTISGLPEFLRAAEGSGLTAVPGVEISSNLYNKEIHILGLFVDPVSPELNAFLEDLRNRRNIRNRQMIEKLNIIGYRITLAELQAAAPGESAGRPHVAELLVKKGYFATIQDAFDSLLKRGARAYTPREPVPPGDCIAAIHAAGGLAFWAHPVYRARSERATVRRFLKVLVPLGLDGLEAYYSVFTARQTAMLNEMAQEFGILRTGGTDYHGEEVHPGIKLGIGTGDLCVPDDLLPPMLEKLERGK
ncbi:MAG: PHP domain-containing protein [Lentisphaeria bacterium]|nr:PHP domain-containing protein [Lentisphaeria bacterium]